MAYFFCVCVWIHAETEVMMMTEVTEKTEKTEKTQETQET